MSANTNYDVFKVTDIDGFNDTDIQPTANQHCEKVHTVLAQDPFNVMAKYDFPVALVEH